MGADTTLPVYDGPIPEISLYDLIAEMKNPNNVVFVEVVEADSTVVLTFIVNGATTFHGDMCYLHDYTPHSTKQFYNVLRGDEWDLTQRYTIDRIGHATLPPVRVRDQKWLRW